MNWFAPSGVTSEHLLRFVGVEAGQRRAPGGEGGNLDHLGWSVQERGGWDGRILGRSLTTIDSAVPIGGGGCLGLKIRISGRSWAV